MPVTVIVGGQFGGEGKGKVACCLALEQGASIAVRCGGTNSGHTVVDANNDIHILRQLPTAAILPDVKLVLCAGSYINPSILEEEVKRLSIPPERLLIDCNATVITPEMIRQEQNGELIDNISSTGSGTGAAVGARIERHQNGLLAKDCRQLRPYIRENVDELFRNSMNGNERLIIEGTQGFGLSLLHSPYYPFVTSRDTPAMAFLSEAGISPFDVDCIVLTLRTFPIRVGGHSGPLPNEIDWDTLVRDFALPPGTCEYASVTKKLRRIARFDYDIVRKAISTNRPTHIIMNHIDYLSGSRADNYKTVDDFVESFARITGQPINYIGVNRKSISLVERASCQ